VVGLVDIAVVIAFVSCFVYLKVISMTEEEEEDNENTATNTNADPENLEGGGLEMVVPHNSINPLNKNDKSKRVQNNALFMQEAPPQPVKRPGSKKRTKSSPTQVEQLRKKRTKSMEARRARKRNVSLKVAYRNPLKKRGRKKVQVDNNDIKILADGIESIESLEDGWTKEIDPSTGYEYLYNEEKGETKWVNEVVDESGLLNDANENPLIETNETNDNWVKKIDSETGSEYWHNEETDETKWVEEEVVGEEDDLARSENENPLVDKDAHVDPGTGRRYSFDEDTGQSEWVVE